MLLWKNSWFQIAFFAMLVSGVLLVLDYAPTIPAIRRGLPASRQKTEQPAEDSAAQSSPSEHPAPAEHSAPPAAPLPSREVDSATKSSVPVQTPIVQAPVKKPANPPNPAATKSAVPKDTPVTTEQPKGRNLETWEWYEKEAAGGNLGAVETLKGAANEGHVGAQYLVGRMYEKGEGVKKDSNEAMKWYGLAAAQGNQSAQQALDRLRTHRSTP
jgi:hypothetical protein